MIMYMICWTTLDGQNKWEVVKSDKAMQEKVSELETELNCDADDIIVFDGDDEIA